MVVNSFFTLKSAEHEIYPDHKHYNNCWHFDIIILAGYMTSFGDLKPDNSIDFGYFFNILSRLHFNLS